MTRVLDSAVSESQELALTPQRLRWLALSMAGGTLVICGAAVALGTLGRLPLPDFVRLTLAGLAVASLVVGVLLAVTADRTSRGSAARIVVSLALREAAGLLGAVLTFLGGGPGWALGLGAVAILAILALLPPADR